MKRLRIAFVIPLLLAGCARQEFSSSTPAPVAVALPTPLQKIGPVDFEELTVKAHADQIDAELASLDRDSLKDSDWAKEWAGTYYEGDGLGENVTIHLAPKSGIAYLNYGCLGLYGAGHGQIAQVLPDGLMLNLTTEDRVLSRHVYFVRWGQRRFLVAESSILRFVNDYNQGGFFREEMFGIPEFEYGGLNTRGSRPPTPTTKPELPASYAKLLLDAPLHLKTLNVEPRRIPTGVSATQYTIEFEGGADQGVYEGLEFWYPDDIMSLPLVVEIVSVSATACTGVANVYQGDHQTFPAVGEIVSNQRKQ
jgi:hypothetical protein